MLKKAPRAEATRQRVLDAALAVYEAHGHEGFNVHAIVADSGVSLGSLYHHFGSMDGVAAALYARSMSQLLEQVAAAVSGKRSLRTGVSGIVTAYLTFARTQRSAMAFIHASAYASFLPAHAAQIQQSKTRMQELRAFFAAYAAAGSIVQVPEALLEVLVIGPVAELTRRWLSAPSLIDLDLAAQTLPERIVAAIEQRSTPRRGAAAGSPATKRKRSSTPAHTGLSAAKRKRT
jgi:AcrR family transcriptional regulator